MPSLYMHACLSKEQVIYICILKTSSLAWMHAFPHPPVYGARPWQVIYHFISGYTSKMAGTEEGITKPIAAFSSCYGEPFLVWHPTKCATPRHATPRHATTHACAHAHRAP